MCIGVTFGCSDAKVLQLFGRNPLLHNGLLGFYLLGLLVTASAVRWKAPRCKFATIEQNFCSGLQCFPNFFDGFGLSSLLVIMGVDPQRHVHCAVFGQVLDFLDIQPSLKHTRDIGVPEDMGRNMCVGKIHADMISHALVGGLRCGFTVFHDEHELRVGLAFPFGQPAFQFFQHGDIPPSCLCFEVVADCENQYPPTLNR